MRLNIQTDMFSLGDVAVMWLVQSGRKCLSHPRLAVYWFG